MGADELNAGQPYIYLRIKRDHPSAIRQIHWNRHPVVMQVVDGSVAVSVNCQRYRLEPGDVLYISAGTMYAVENWEGDADCIYFNPVTFGELNGLRALIENNKNPYLCLRDDGRELVANLHNIFVSVVLSERYFESAAGDMRRTLLAYTDGAYTLVQPENPPHSAKQLAYLRTVLEMIDLHLYEQMTLEQLADAVGLSSKYFCRFFQNMTGQKPFAYINALRIEHACDIFIREKVTVKEVAARLGYKDINYFIKTFKRYRGMTPKKYAAQYYHYTAYIPRY